MFKANCGFRNNSLCFMSAKQCQKEKKGLKEEEYCSLYSVEFTENGINNDIKKNMERLKGLKSDLKSMKKGKADKKTINHVKREVNDAVMGLSILSKALQKLGKLPKMSFAQRRYLMMFERQFKTKLSQQMIPDPPKTPKK